MDKDKVILKYIGNGSLIEIPARDLTQLDLDNLKWTGWDKDKLIESKLYEAIEKIEQEETLEDVYEVITDKEIEQENKIEKQTKKRGK